MSLNSLTFSFEFNELNGNMSLRSEWYLSLVMRKPAFCICENEDADQLCSNFAADQRLCFPYKDGTIPLLPKSEISSF